METRVTEVADGVHQLSTFVGAPVGFNQYLITADEPLLFHTGMRQMFPLVLAGVSKVQPAESLRWISFGHVEADESGAMNEWLAAAPQATVAQSELGCMVSIGDLADRPPRPLADGEKLDIGGHIVQWFDTPHVPHAWEAGVLYDATTKTCSAATSSRGSASTRHQPATTSSARQCTPRTTRQVRCRCTPPAAPRSGGSPILTSRHSPSCTVPRSPETAAQLCSTSPATSTAA